MPIITRDFPIDLQTNKRGSHSAPCVIPNGKTWKILNITFFEKRLPEFDLQLSVNNSLQPRATYTTISQGSFPVANFGFSISAGTAIELVATSHDYLDSPVRVTVQLTILEE